MTRVADSDIVPSRPARARPGFDSGGPCEAFRCTPTPKSGTSASVAAAAAAPGMFAMIVVDVTTPSRCARTMPSEIPREKPKSSALITTRLAWGVFAI